MDILTDFKARHDLELSLEFLGSSELECPHLVRLELELAQLASGSSSQQHYLYTCQLATTGATTSGSKSKDGLRIGEMGGASTDSPEWCVISILNLITSTNYSFLPPQATL